MATQTGQKSKGMAKGVARRNAKTIRGVSSSRKYKNRGRREYNKIRKLAKHVKKHPNDAQALRALRVR